jgi:glutathione S-transferase
MVTVHHLNNSRSQRILWLLEELGVDYDIEKYERNPKTKLAPKSLRKVHPLGKAPVVTHDGNAIAESGAIIEYLVDVFDDGALRPDPETPEFLQYRYFMHYAEGSAMTPFLLKVVFSELPRQSPLPAKPLMAVVAKTVDKMYISGQIDLHVDFWERELSQRPWFAGQYFTAVDIQMSFPLEAAVSNLDMSRYPKVRDFVERIHARPEYQAAIERGGEFEI